MVWDDNMQRFKTVWEDRMSHAMGEIPMWMKAYQLERCIRNPRSSAVLHHVSAQQSGRRY